MDRCECCTKEKIIKVTLDLIGQEGIHEVTTRKIASIANVNSAAINYYFGSKENLINTSLLHFFKSVEGIISSLDDTSVQPMERIERFLRMHFDYINTYPGVMRSVIVQAVSSKKINPMFEQTLKIGIPKFKKAFAEALNMDDDFELLLIILNTMSSMLYPILVGDVIGDIARTTFGDVVKPINDKLVREKYIDIVMRNLKNLCLLSDKGEKNEKKIS